MKTIEMDATLDGERDRSASRLKVLVVSLYHPELVRGGAQQVA
jgi:hypothetical protein